MTAAGTAGKRVTEWLTARPSGSRGPQDDSNRPLLSLVVQLWAAVLFPAKFQARIGPAIPRE